MSSTSPLVSIFSQVNFTLTADNEVGCEIIIRLVIVVAVRNISRIFSTHQIPLVTPLFVA